MLYSKYHKCVVHNMHVSKFKKKEKKEKKKAFRTSLTLYPNKALKVSPMDQHEIFIQWTLKLCIT
jgi:hypothetical protein